MRLHPSSLCCMPMLIIITALSSNNIEVAAATFLDDLEDAVQNVGTFLSEVGSGANIVLDGWKFINEFIDATIDESCEFSCKLGYKPVNNTNYIPSSNGCGSLGVQWNTEHMPVEQLTDCCNAHDLCYDTCGADRDFCDLAFKKCLYAVCDRQKRSHNKLAQKVCKGTSKMLYTGTLALGCKPFRDAQKLACKCVRQDTRTT